MRLAVLIILLLTFSLYAQNGKATGERYKSDFESGAGSEWSNTKSDSTPVGGRRFLGQFGNESVTLSLTKRKAGMITLEFDLFLINSWDGNYTGYGPDYFIVSVGGKKELIRTTFSNLDENNWKQSYPATAGIGNNPAHTGAREKDSLGYKYFGDSVYRLRFMFRHETGPVEIKFSAKGLQDLSDESWGIANVKVDGASKQERSDLIVSSFNIRSRGIPMPLLWEASVKVKNVGQQKIAKGFQIHLEQIDTSKTADMLFSSPSKWRVVPSSATNIRNGLKPGEEQEILFQFGRQRPSEEDLPISRSADRLRVIVDPKNEIGETNEDNNKAELRRLSCDPPSADPDLAGHPLRSVWLDLEEAEKPNRYESVLRRFPARTLRSKAEKVLCYIRLEAQKRAKADRSTVQGSDFISRIESEYFKNYSVSAFDAIEEIGAIKGQQAFFWTLNQYKQTLIDMGLPVTLIENGYMNIPIGVQRKFKTGPQFQVQALFPAVEVLFTLKTSKAGGKTVLDVPFLVGDPNFTASGDGEFFSGGRNWSNVMHWATGVRYNHVKPDAMRAVFLGYEYWHLEGWKEFGTDAINDLIAEEQGRLFGDFVRSQYQNRKINRKILISAMDSAFRRSRA